MGQVHELLAVLPDRRSQYVKTRDRVKKTFDPKVTPPTKFIGIHQEYVPLDSEESNVVLADTNPAIRVLDVWVNLLSAFAQVVDISGGIDKTNCDGSEACADITVGGSTIIGEVPVPALLKMKDDVADLLGIARTIPTIDPTKKYEFDTEDGLYKVEATKDKSRNERYGVTGWEPPPGDTTRQAIVEFTDKQVKIGQTKTIESTSAISQKMKRAIIKYLEDLLSAIMIAKTKGNKAEIKRVEYGKSLTKEIISIIEA